MLVRPAGLPKTAKGKSLGRAITWKGFCCCARRDSAAVPLQMAHVSGKLRSLSSVPLFLTAAWTQEG